MSSPAKPKGRTKPSSGAAAAEKMSKAKGSKRGREEPVGADVPSASEPPAPAAAADLPYKFQMLKKPVDLNQMLQASDVTAVTFDKDFGIQDQHITQLAQALGPQLRELRLGSSDTGDGVHVTDAAVLRVVQLCPHLEVLQLASCTRVSNKAFAAILERLHQLRELHVTGHDRTSGALKGKALDPLVKDNALPKLRKLFLTDQGLGYEAVDKVMKKRKGLQVQAGTTDGDSFAYGMVMQATGGSYGDGLYGNMRW